MLDDYRPTERPKWAGVAEVSHTTGVGGALTFEPRHSLVKEHLSYRASLALACGLRFGTLWLSPPVHSISFSRRTRVNQSLNQAQGRTYSSSDDAKRWTTQLVLRLVVTDSSSVTQLLREALTEENGV